MFLRYKPYVICYILCRINPCILYKLDIYYILYIIPCTNHYHTMSFLKQRNAPSNASDLASDRASDLASVLASDLVSDFSDRMDIL